MEEMVEWLSLFPAITKGSVIRAALGWILGLGAVIMIFMEFMPIIKLHPITTMLRWIGDKVNKEVIVEVNNLKEAVDGIKKENSQQYAISCRARILRFGDELRQGSKHSKESFDQILEDIDYYDSYCYNHPDFKNNRTHLTTKKILESYSLCLDQDNFL